MELMFKMLAAIELTPLGLQGVWEERGWMEFAKVSEN